jgi:hypothetical protein
MTNVPPSPRLRRGRRMRNDEGMTNEEPRKRLRRTRRVSRIEGKDYEQEQEQDAEVRPEMG